MSITAKSFRFVVTIVIAIFAFSLSAVAQDAVERVDQFLQKDGKIDRDVDKAEALIEATLGVEEFGAEVAQTSSYSFATGTTGSVTDMSSGTTQLLGGNIDDTASPLTNIGFDFYYMGSRYAQFSINDNGVLRLGAAAQTSTPYQPLAQLNIPLITAYGADQRTHIGDGKVHYKVTGAVGSRVLTIEWLNNQSNFNTGGTADLTYQVRLYESTGVIEFVYGSMTMSTAGAADTNSNDPHVGLSSSNVANTVGSVTAPQAGSPTFNGTSNDPTENLYTAGAITVLTGATDGARRTISFTPPTPSAPTNLTFTGVTALSITLNWTDSPDEDLYGIYRSTDGINYSFVATAAESATSFTDSTVAPGTTYFYGVFAVSEGALSTALSGSQATSPAGSDTCSATPTVWTAATSWADGSVPTVADNVTIQSGCTMLIDTAAPVALGVTVQSGGTLMYDPLVAGTLTVTNDVTIDAGGSFTAGAGAVTTHALSLGGNLVNNGTLDFSTTAGAGLTFTGAANKTFSGTGATTDIRTMTINKGTSNASILEITPSNFTVQGVNTDAAGFLTLTNGTLKISGTFTAANRVFTTAGYTIGATTGFWLNNPNFTVSGQNGSPTNNGLLRITDGTFNVGTSIGNSMGGGAGAVFTIEGGTSNFAGRLQTTSTVTYNQLGGSVNVCTVGNAAATACFGLTATANTFNMTGGTIVLNLPSTNATPLDYSVSSAANFVANPAGTTLQMGTGAAAETFRVTGNTPNILIPANKTMNVGSGTGATIFFRGSTVTNSGAIGTQGANSRFDWAASGPMSYGGIGSFGTAGTSFGGVGMSANSPTGHNTTINSPIFIDRINLFSGGFANSGQITLGNSGASTTVIQVGNTTTPSNAGTFDVSPVYNSGSGGHIALHLRTTTLNRLTGFEINPTRNLASWIVDENAVGGTLTLTGGNLTVSGAMTLTNGVIVTNSTNTLTHNGAVTRTAGFVKGPLRRDFAVALATAYTYHVGDGVYSPVGISNITATAPAELSAEAVNASPAGFNPASSISRYWNMNRTGSGTLTADATYTYDQANDVSGNEADYRLFRSTTEFCGIACVDETINVATAIGVSTFSPWTIAESGAVLLPVVVSPTTLPNGTVGTAYSETITASGGLPPYTFAVTAGALPTGLTLATNGNLTGTPTATGTFNFTITATDSATPTAGTGSQAYSVVISLPPCTPPSTVFVDDDWVGTPIDADPDGAGPATRFGCDSFATIQDGHNGVTNPGTVIVGAGTYKENPNVTKSLLIRGAGFGVDARTRVAPESIVLSNGNQNAVFSVTGAAGVTIDGFTIDGDDPTVAGPALLFSGEDTNVLYGVRPTGAVSSLNVSNNIIKRAFIGLRGDVASQGNIVNQNLFDSIGNFDFGYCVSIRNNFYANVTNNLMTRAWTGVHINNHNGPGGPASFNVTGNEIHAYAGGILYWLQYNQATGATITGNTMTAEATAVANNFGILAVSIQDAVNPTFTGNAVSGHDYGVGLFNVSTTNAITLGSTNSITGSELSGVFLTDNLNFNPIGTTNFLAGGPGAASTVNVSAMSITGNLGNGVRVEGMTNVQNLNVTNSTITGIGAGSGLVFDRPQAGGSMTGNTVTGFATGVSMPNNGGSSAAITVNYNRIISSSSAVNGPGAGVAANLTNNWWGCNAGPGNTGCGTYNGSSVVTPWVVLGTSASPTIVMAGGNSTLTADMTQNSAGGTLAQNIPTTPVSYTAVNGSMSPTSGSITAGMGTSTFTATTTSGQACATVDSQLSCATVQVPVVVSPATLPNGTVGVAYSQTITASGGTPPYTFSVTAGTLPTGLTLAANGNLSGTPTATGTFNFTITATDSAIPTAGTGSQAYTINIGPAAPMIQFGAPSFTEDESQTAQILITRTGDTSGTASVNFSAVSGGVATGGAACGPGIDFITVNNAPISFAIGDTEKFAPVTICGGDTQSEFNETISLSLTMASGAGLGTPNTATLNINDTASQYLTTPPHTSIDMLLGQGATPYPSTITVAGGPSLIGGMRVTLYDVWHFSPDNMDVLLVGPGGQKYILQSDVGGANAVPQSSPVTITFTDAVAVTLPDSGQLTTGQFLPTSCETPVTDFPTGAPVGPYIEPGCTPTRPSNVTLFGVFGNTTSNGTWSLYVRDDNGFRPFEKSALSIVGSISGGWGLEFNATTAAEVSISGRVTNSDGRGITNASVTVTGGSLTEPIRVVTGRAGRYTAPGLAAGETYVVTVGARRFTFSTPSRVLTLNDNAEGIDFVADGQQ